MLVNASGRLDPQEATYIPDSEHHKVVRVARIWVLVYAATIGVAVTMQSWLPLLLVGTPRLYGAWHHVMTGMLQHGGLADNVTDHRLNTRTVMMNPVSRFIYWNMNYHVEHHVPQGAVPRAAGTSRDGASRLAAALALDRRRVCRDVAGAGPPASQRGLFRPSRAP